MNALPNGEGRKKVSAAVVFVVEGGWGEEDLGVCARDRIVCLSLSGQGDREGTQKGRERRFACARQGKEGCVCVCKGARRKGECHAMHA